ncbi:PINIT domain-domain-containing protein [Protomyces lactucae-debilis]|uniref:PINIT domain-domain-containing protein n=1 Tax=Protomyces lactucae-debilis TaxID=2754530 RepID=A0A1Y2FQ49_PROLT|nr:PINIT domain-containing protein [Protomyces lactucae-debilis]ORY86098.1 PINIT domain-domain-containing protein [Protomyces lactucae-debilis]
MSGAPDPFADSQILSRQIESRLLVSDLKEVLKACGLSTYGNKRPLIDRLLSSIASWRNTNNVVAYQTLRTALDRVREARTGHVVPPQQLPTGQQVRPQQARPPLPGYNVAAVARPAAVQAPRPAAPALVEQKLISFKESPFFTLLEKVSERAYCTAAARNTVTTTFMLKEQQLKKLEEPGYAMMVFSAEAQSSNYMQVPIEFPTPSELLCNGKKINANLRGLKGKPGTVPPADITKHLQLSSRVSNRIDLTYQGTTRKFCYQVALVKKNSVADLVARVRKGRYLTKESVLAKLRRPDDDDIEMSSFDLTLKDPLAYTRITLPCRSLNCRHNQCFDCEVFFMSNEQTPTWTCPICTIPIPNEHSIVVDGYFQDILSKVDSEVDTILVDPQGNWKVPQEKSAQDVELPEKSAENGMKHEIFDLDGVCLNPPLALPSRLLEVASSRSASPASTHTPKRKAPPVEVIDLTSDTDDEAPAPPPAKRPHVTIQAPVQQRPQSSRPMGPFERAALVAAARNSAKATNASFSASSMSSSPSAQPANPFPVPVPAGSEAPRAASIDNMRARSPPSAQVAGDRDLATNGSITTSNGAPQDLSVPLQRQVSSTSDQPTAQALARQESMNTEVDEAEAAHMRLKSGAARSHITEQSASDRRQEDEDELARQQPVASSNGTAPTLQATSSLLPEDPELDELFSSEIDLDADQL